ncbi:MAG: Gfo/Idh/MocA family protein, partial [Anaerolineales bacterium]
MHKRFYKLTIVLNAAVETVYAEIGTRLYPDLAVEDSANVVLRFAPGAVAAIDTSWSLPPGNPFESELS